MSSTAKSAVIFAACFVIFKLIFFNTGLHDNNYVVVVFANILFVVLAMIFGLRFARKDNPEENRTYTQHVKTSMRAASLYAILISAFSYLYYSKIDQGFVQHRIEERMELARNVDFAELQKMNPEKLQGKNREDFLQAEKENAELWFSPFFLSTLTLMGLILISLFYSLLIAWFWGKFIGRISQ